MKKYLLACIVLILALQTAKQAFPYYEIRYLSKFKIEGQRVIIYEELPLSEYQGFVHDGVYNQVSLPDRIIIGNENFKVYEGGK